MVCYKIFYSRLFVTFIKYFKFPAINIELSKRMFTKTFHYVKVHMNNYTVFEFKCRICLCWLKENVHFLIN